MLRGKKGRFLFTTSFVLVCNLMLLFSISMQASAREPIWTLPGAVIECGAGTTGSTGWQTSSSGGYVGPELYGECDGSYKYANQPSGKTGTWGLRGILDFSTDYLWVYFPDDRAGATEAIYTVTTNLGTWNFTVNQRSAAGWYRLGQFSYSNYDISVSVTAGPSSQGPLLADAVARRGY